MLAPVNYEAGSKTLGLTFSLNRRCQIRYRQPLWSGYTRPSGAPSPWVGPSAVWGDTDTAVWGSWRHQSRCPSNPSVARTWGPTGPGSMMSSAGRLGPAGPGGKYPNLQHLGGKRRERCSPPVFFCFVHSWFTFVFPSFINAETDQRQYQLSEALWLQVKLTWRVKHFWNSSICASWLC